MSVSVIHLYSAASTALYAVVILFPVILILLPERLRRVFTTRCYTVLLLHKLLIKALPVTTLYP